MEIRLPLTKVNYMESNAKIELDITLLCGRLSTQVFMLNIYFFILRT